MRVGHRCRSDWRRALIGCHEEVAVEAVIVTQPGSKSQQNAQRRGFDLLYTRAILVKHPS
jgi:hypothetical protein